MVIRVRKTSTNPDFRGVNPSSEPRAVLHRSGRASFLPRNADFRIGRASFLPRNADFRIGRAVFSPRAADFRSGNPCFLPRAELFRPVGALLSRHRRHRSRRFFSFPIHYIYIRARGERSVLRLNGEYKLDAIAFTINISDERYAGGIAGPGPFILVARPACA